MKLKRVLICVAAFLLACSFGLTSRVSVKAEGENIGNFSEDFENYTVGGYIEADELFKQNWEKIKTGKCEGFLPGEKGTYHTMKELAEFRKNHPFEWNENIGECKKRWNKQ